jgi:hypothetical protein
MFRKFKGYKQANAIETKAKTIASISKIISIVDSDLFVKDMKVDPIDEIVDKSFS